MALRFLAGALGARFLSTRSGLHTDILAQWGFSAEERAPSLSAARASSPPASCVRRPTPTACRRFSSMPSSKRLAPPTTCFRRYDDDPAFPNTYRAAAKNDEAFAAWLDNWVYGVAGHDEYLARVGAPR